MNLLDLMTEDTTTDINNINTQIADLNVRKSRATKVFDDQIKRLQQQLANKTKEAQRTAPQLQNTQQQNQQTAPQLQPQR
jgi:gas vesicle protein